MRQISFQWQGLAELLILAKERCVAVWLNDEEELLLSHQKQKYF